LTVVDLQEVSGTVPLVQGLPWVQGVRHDRTSATGRDRERTH